MNNLLAPKKTKYKKLHKNPFKNYKKTFLIKGSVGLQLLEPLLISSKQIETCRKTILRYTKRIGKIFINVFPDNPRTKKSEGSRMGVGKGSLNFWCSPVRSGKILFELQDISLITAKKALKQVKYKLPVQTKIIEKNN